jgi:hypothetical protein
VKTQIGFMTLTEPKVFRVNYEVARWYKDIEVQPGEYPLMAEVSAEGTVKNISCDLPGKNTGSDFTSLFCGNAIGAGKFDEEVGKDEVYHYWSMYGYGAADWLDRSGITLLPEFVWYTYHCSYQRDLPNPEYNPRVRNDANTPYLFNPDKPSYSGRILLRGSKAERNRWPFVDCRPITQPMTLEQWKAHQNEPRFYC